MFNCRSVELIGTNQSFLTGKTVAQLAQELQQYFTQAWWDCESSLPELPGGGAASQKHARERQLDGLIDGLIFALKRSIQDDAGRQSLNQEILKAASDYLVDQLGFNLEHIKLIRTYRFLELAAEFAQKAHQYDPAISDEDIFQASRNVMTMNFIQLLFGMPVCLTPSIFAYSMLYPYTDNYLDDPRIPLKTKAAFGEVFQRRLSGEPLTPGNDYEKTIFDLVSIVEGEYEREKYPQVYESLLLIHEAQVRSLHLLRQQTSPYEVDVLGITFAKGGTSVLADGYLVAGNINWSQAKFLYGYGAFTQLMDDLEDTQNDLDQGQMTLFSQNAGRWPLDALTNHTIHFGHKVIATMECFTSHEGQTFRDFLSRCIDPLLIDSISQFGRYYQRSYVSRMEACFPFHFSFISKMRKKLLRQKFSLVKLAGILE